MTINIEAQPTDLRTLNNIERDVLVVSAISVDGFWQIISRYGDDVWELSGGATNLTRSKRLTNFNNVPTAFKEKMKSLMYRYLLRGRRGGSKPGVRRFSNFFYQTVQFLKYLERLNIHQFAAVTPFVCFTYAQECKTRLGRKGKPLAITTLSGIFTSIEALYELSQYIDDRMPAHPWPEDSAWNLAGMTGKKSEGRMLVGRTPLIPDDVFSSLFQAAWDHIQQGEKLLDMRDELEKININLKGSKRFAIWNAKCKYLKSQNWQGGLSTFNSRISDLRTACYIVVASLSGCRNHELAYVQTNACYSTIDNEGEEFWWMKSRSTKTDEGKTEWMIPIAAVTALRLMDRWAQPYQLELVAEIDRRRSVNPTDTEIAEAQKHIGAVFVGRDSKLAFKNAPHIRTLSDRSWTPLLRFFARKHGINWNITTHQFRRTFANYAARSKFGDLRYLKEHYKHWSLDMTLAYAMNEYQEVALYSEIYDELADLKEGLVSNWMEPGEPLAGGLGQRVMAWRGSNEVSMFKDHKSMVKTLAEGFGSLRSNGHAWCTADQGIDCIGNGGLDRTRCTGCDHAVIGRIHARIYQGMYDQLKTTLQCEDIGEAGRAYVNRSISRCVDVLRSFGHNLEEQNA